VAARPAHIVKCRRIVADTSFDPRSSPVDVDRGMPDEHEHLDPVRWRVHARASMIGASLLTIVSGCATGQDKPLPVEDGNYYQDEAIRWVKQRFGEDTFSGEGGQSIRGSDVPGDVPKRNNPSWTPCLYSRDDFMSSRLRCRDVLGTGMEGRRTWPGRDLAAALVRRARMRMETGRPVVEACRVVWTRAWSRACSWARSTAWGLSPWEPCSSRGTYS
jgi:hypothetical protein